MSRRRDRSVTDMSNSHGISTRLFFIASLSDGGGRFDRSGPGADAGGGVTPSPEAVAAYREIIDDLKDERGKAGLIHGKAITDLNNVIATLRAADADKERMLAAAAAKVTVLEGQLATLTAEYKDKVAGLEEQVKIRQNQVDNLKRDGGRGDRPRGTRYSCRCRATRCGRRDPPRGGFGQRG